MREVLIGTDITSSKSYKINMLINRHISELIGNEDEILIIDPNREIFYRYDVFVFTGNYNKVKSRIKYMLGTEHNNFSTLISQCHLDILSNKYKYIFIDYVHMTDAEIALLKYYQNNTSPHSTMFVTSALLPNQITGE